MVSSHQKNEALKLFRMKVMGVKATGFWRDLSARKACDCGLTSYCNSCQHSGLLAQRCLLVPYHRFCSCRPSLFYFQAYLIFFISARQHERISMKATGHKQCAPLTYALRRLKGFQDLLLWLQRLKHHHGMLCSSTSCYWLSWPWMATVQGARASECVVELGTELGSPQVADYWSSELCSRIALFQNDHVVSILWESCRRKGLPKEDVESGCHQLGKKRCVWLPGTGKNGTKSRHDSFVGFSLPIFFSSFKRQ